MKALETIEQAKKIALKPTRTVWSIITGKLYVNRMTTEQRVALHFILDDLSNAFSEVREMHTEACEMKVGDSDTDCTCWVLEHRRALMRLNELIKLVKPKK